MAYPGEGTPHPQSTSVFASLHRKSRNSEPAAAAPPTPAADTKESRDAAVKESKRYLLETVRNDWSFELAPSLSTTITTTTGQPQFPPPSTTTTTTATTNAPVQSAEVREWRERGQDSSCSDTENVGLNGRRGSATSRDPYRFESPDSVEFRVLERRRKRRKLVEEEMQWNAGLRLWMERRDAWSGAKKMRRGRLSSFERDSALHANRRLTPDVKSNDGSRVGSYTGSDDVDMLNAGSEDSSRPVSTVSGKGFAGFTPTILPDDGPVSSSCAHGPDEPLVPVVQPLLPASNPVRASITPAIYPSIYSKIIIQSLTPAVPINLSDVTKALVQGWKADGEWPPKPTMPQDPPVARKKPTTTAESSAKSKRLSGSGVTGAVKKVFGFSGSRFHIRSSSHGGGGGGGGRTAGDTGDQKS
ncbi:hypothetical protein AJ80_02465 [Polytolypa hystricis UAMH7299]|uniref:Gag1-like clamp domain-containing protein n=1 Tax=Polytolypa hystricis (strain UAMH7299) TaxID=1447883 RepID=A0A2B7YR23_POLH7|nr:hypothetical protein AJ80_02465 [Polytolypa hystricis UAMH7299]